MSEIAYRTADVDGLTGFYREAGPADAPTLVLLHGFLSASHMFRELIPLLADRFHIVAPDLPGFGKSDMPPRGDFDYTFEHIADVIDRLTEVPGLDRFALYVFDYGAPVGFRIAARHPEREQRGALPGVPGVLPHQQAAAARGVGQQRPVLPARRSRGIQARHPRR
jgi:pimeloyl-ACP methyl ester carboxylesterase